MKISVEQWQKWATTIACKEAGDFCRNVKLDLKQGVILQAKLEVAALNGMEVAAEMSNQGYDLSEITNAKPTLYKHQCGTSPEKERQTVTEAAQSLHDYLWDNVGPTADYPIDIKIDNQESAEKLMALLQNLKQALKQEKA